MYRRPKHSMLHLTLQLLVAQADVLQPCQQPKDHEYLTSDNQSLLVTGLQCYG